MDTMALGDDKMRKYYMCLDEHNYNVIVGDNDNVIEVLNNYEMMLDNLINLLRSYAIPDDEILDEIKNDLDIEIEECE